MIAIEEARPADILIVDDMPANIRLLAGMLAQRGHRVREALDGAAGLEMARSRLPDLILLDVRMPGIDGYEVCRRLKADEAAHRVPILFVSAVDDLAEKVQAFSVGGVDYITRPFNVQEVLARVETHLTLARLQRRLEEQNTRLQQEIDERRRAETALQRANEELERRVDARTAELAQINLTLNTELIERRRAEAERELLLFQVGRQAEQVRAIMNTVPEGLLLLDSEWRVVMANSAGEKYLHLLAAIAPGERLEHLGSMPVDVLLSDPTLESFHEITYGSAVFEVHLRSAAGQAPGRRRVLLLRDVTREREDQRRLQHQDRLAAVGQMAAGIAHDFNNILAVIQLYADMALNAADIPAALHERLRIIEQQSRRASELIEQILDFSRQSVFERRPMHLLPFIKEQIKLLERTLPEDIRIECALELDDFIIQADPTRMQQLLMNLAVNARDAMPRGGKLAISLSRVDSDHPIACISCGEGIHGEWAALTVSDTGRGIAAGDLPHVFEPFYTTKEPGKGTGLGLAQVYGIVKSHGGHLQVASKNENGTLFSLYFPLLANAAVEPIEPEPASLVNGHGQTILLVEDDAATRHALAEGLQIINYHVILAANGIEALSKLHARPNAVDLVISDVVMPEMGGLDMAQCMRRDQLNQPVIFLTGHAIPESAPEKFKAIWVPKPARLKPLSQIIARALKQ